MTREEASKVIKDGIDDMSLDYFDEEQYEALEMAIKALEQEPCIQEKQANADKIDAVYIDGFKAGYSQARFDLEQEPSGDLISRQELLEDLYKRDYTKFTHRDFVALVQYQDTVQQEPKTGHWILDETDNSITCDKCGCLIWANDISNGEAYYCPNCGCNMESEDKE